MRPLAGIGLVLLLVAGAGADEPPFARLIYQRGDTTGCPDEDSLHNTVAARLGYDPFRPEAASTVSATIERSGGGLRARVELRDGSGRISGARSLASPRNDCYELSASVALAISIAIDPLRFAVPPPLPPPLPPAAPPPCAPCVCLPSAPLSSPPPLPPPAPTPPRRGVDARFRGGLGVLGSFGALPAPTVGFTAHVGVRLRSFSLAVEARADLPVRVPNDPRDVDAMLLMGSLVPCYHLGSLLHLCALVGAGAVLGSSHAVTQPRSDASLLIAAGVRIGVELPIYKWLAVRAHSDLLAPITRTVLQIREQGVEQNVWVAPVLSAALGLTLQANFR